MISAPPPGHPGIIRAPAGKRNRTAGGERRAERQQTSVAARSPNADPPGALLPGWRAGQRTRRHPLPAGPHRPVPGTDSRRGQLEYLQDGSRRVARRFDHRFAPGCVAGNPTRHAGLRVKNDGDFTTVDLTVLPVPTDPEGAIPRGLFLIIRGGVGSGPQAAIH
jgi:hypothetical protein